MIPPAEAPTWFCVLRDDLVIPKGSAGYALERQIESRLGGPRSIAVGLLAGGAAMVAVDRRAAGHESRIGFGAERCLSSEPARVPSDARPQIPDAG